MLSDELLDSLEKMLNEYPYDIEDIQFLKETVTAARTNLLANIMLVLTIVEIAEGKAFSLADKLQIVMTKAYPFLPPDKHEEAMDFISEIRNGNQELIDDLDLVTDQYAATIEARRILGEKVTLQELLDHAEEKLQRWVAQ